MKLADIWMRDATILPDPATQTDTIVASDFRAVRAYTGTDLVTWEERQMTSSDPFPPHRFLCRCKTSFRWSRADSLMSIPRLFGICSLVAGSLSAAGPPSIVPGPPTRVLIVDGFSNHDWQHTTALIRGVIEPTGLFDVQMASVVRGAVAILPIGPLRLSARHLSPRNFRSGSARIFNLNAMDRFLLELAF